MDCRAGQFLNYGFKLLRVAGVVFLLVGFLYIVVHRFEAYKRCEAKFLKDQVQMLEYKQRQHTKDTVKTSGDHRGQDEDHDEHHMTPTVQPRQLFMSSAFEVSGLGNQMFQYASLLGIAAYYGMVPVIPSALKLNAYFSLSAQKSNETRPGQNWGKVIANRASAFQSKVLNMKDIDQNLELVGFFQSWKYFENADMAIKNEFQFSGSIRAKARAFLQSAKTNYTAVHNISSPTIIGIHVRRGDMSSARFHEIGYTTVNASYIRAAMDYMAKKHSNILYIVCSDDIPWAKDNIRPVNPTNMIQFSTSLDDITDLAVLTMTDHLILSTGTFSWWAGWLSRGEVIYCKHFPREDSRLARMFSHDKMDYYCPGWTPL